MALAWIILSAIVLLGPAIYYNLPQTVHVLTVVSGAVTAVIGKSGLTPAKGAATDWTGISANIALAIAGPLFAALVLILFSVIVDWSVIGGFRPCFPTNDAWDCHSWWWLLPIIAAAGVLWTANYFGNINAFSLHAVYRNRLIRAFVGGARAPHRHPDGFTDFDWDDDLRVASLWDRKTLPTGENWRPLHIINITLNLGGDSRTIVPLVSSSIMYLSGYNASNTTGGTSSYQQNGYQTCLVSAGNIVLSGTGGGTASCPA